MEVEVASIFRREKFACKINEKRKPEREKAEISKLGCLCILLQYDSYAHTSVIHYNVGLEYDGTFLFTFVFLTTT